MEGDDAGVGPLEMGDVGPLGRAVEDGVGGGDGLDAELVAERDAAQATGLGGERVAGCGGRQPGGVAPRGTGVGVPSCDAPVVRWQKQEPVGMLDFAPWRREAAIAGPPLKSEDCRKCLLMEVALACLLLQAAIG